MVWTLMPRLAAAARSMKLEAPVPRKTMCRRSLQRASRSASKKVWSLMQMSKPSRRLGSPSGWPSAMLTRMDGSSGRSTRCHSSTMPVRQSRKSTGIATAPACQGQSIRRPQRGTTEAICDPPRDHVSRSVAISRAAIGQNAVATHPFSPVPGQVRIGRTIMGPERLGGIPCVLIGSSRRCNGGGKRRCR